METTPIDHRLNVKFTRLAPQAKTPTKATSGSGAYDIYSTDELLLAPEGRYAFGTGLAMEIPDGFVALVCPRSGLAIKNGVTVLNAPGVVDSDYRGEVKAIVINHDLVQPLQVNKGDKIAQLLFVRAEQAEFEEVEALSSTQRGAGGFGSTGK